MAEEVEELHIREFELESILPSATIVLIASPGGGKSSVMENICYRLKHRYPVARVFCGIESGYKEFCKIFHPLYVSNYYAQEEEVSHVTRQRTCALENGQKHPSNYAINIIDDACDAKDYSSKLFKGLFKVGSQHWNQLLLVGLQYGIDFKPDVRKAISYVFIGKEDSPTERRKLFENFAGICGEYSTFCQLMDQITGNFTFLVINKRSPSTKIEDCVFFYQTEDPKKRPPWKFGCKEYKDWAESRYDKSYVEKVEDYV